MVWPEFMVVGFADITGVVSAELTVTDVAVEVTVSGGEPLSVTFSSNDQEPAVDRAPVETVGLSPALHGNETPRLL